MHMIPKEMQACIDACLNCYQMCFGMAMTHCLEKGGEHVKPFREQFRLVRDYCEAGLVSPAQPLRDRALGLRRAEDGSYFSGVTNPRHSKRGEAPMPGTARARAVGFDHVALEVGDIEAASERRARRSEQIPE